MAKPRLLAYLNGPPDAETLAPVLCRLGARRRVALSVIALDRLIRQQPGIGAAFAASGVPMRAASKLRMKTRDVLAILQADAVLSIADPNYEIPSRRHRAWLLSAARRRAIFLQHGVYQLGVNAFPDPKPYDYASDPVLLWEAPGPLHAGLSAATLARVRVAGFVKAPLWPAVLPQDPALQKWMGAHAVRILLCHSFRWRGDRFGPRHVAGFFDMVARFATAHPDIGVMIRPHRGRDKAETRAGEDRLVATCPNIVVSRAASGVMAGATITEALAAVHALVGPASTVILDGAFAGRPVAVLEDDVGLFPELARIEDAGDLATFLGTLNRTPHPSITAMIDRFGPLDAALDRAAQHIEAALGVG